jgi:hypothetical protein
MAVRQLGTGALASLKNGLPPRDPHHPVIDAAGPRWRQNDARTIERAANQPSFFGVRLGRFHRSILGSIARICSQALHEHK